MNKENAMTQQLNYATPPSQQTELTELLAVTKLCRYWLNVIAMLMIVLMTNDRRLMGDKVNSFWLNALSWLTVIAIFAATIGLVASWVL